MNVSADQPHSARMYDYYLGGKENYAVDREAAEAITAQWAGIRTAAKVNRAFMHRAVRFLVDAGVRQFLDIGTGIPTEPNLHQVAQEIAPDCRVVYVDKDPLVLAHARALMAGTDEGATTYLQADVTDPGSILEAGALREVLDLDRPVGLSMIALLHFIESDAHDLIRAYLDALAPGSYLAICTATADFAPEQVERAAQIYRAGGISAKARNRGEVAELFQGVELIEPGIVPPHRWRPDGITEVPPSYDGSVSCYAGIARKP